MAVQERQAAAEGAVELPEPWRSVAVTVVLPTYNEAANLPVIVAELLGLPLANLRILGTTMGNRYDLEQLVQFCVARHIRPPIHQVLPLSETREGFAAMLGGELFGKVVVQP